MRLVLASASPRRADLLRTAGFAFDTLVVDIDERVRPGETAAAYVRRLAMEKSARAMGVLAGLTKTGLKTCATSEVGLRATSETGVAQVSSPARDGIVVLGADTAVVIDGNILGKPGDDEDAAAMLRQLSGRSHEVLTGLSLRTPGRECGRVETTVVEFSPLTEADVMWYVASAEGRDKAGGYAIQGLASRFIPRIRGSYSNVVGLPIAAVHELVAEIASEPRSGLF
jgi:septum formation protein